MTIASSTLSWLLQAETPSIHYFTLTRLLDLPEDDPRVSAARQAIPTTGPAPEICAGQTGHGNWAGEHNHYTHKYTSTHWAMTLLAELGMDGSVERMRRGTEFMLADTAGSTRRSIDRSLADLPCFWGNLLRYTLQSGFQDGPLTLAVIDLLGQVGLEGGWRCRYNHGDPCAWGAARALWGLAAIADPEGCPGAGDTIASGLHFLLDEHSLLTADYPAGGGEIHSIWAKLNFPLFYQADILFILRVLAELGAVDRPGAQPALDWLAGLRRPNGRFAGASPFRSRTYAAMGAPEETARWVTLQAEWILKKAGRG